MGRIEAVNEVDKDGKTCLHHAVAGGHLEMVKYLIECGCNTAAVDNSGKSATALATYHDHDEILTLLVMAANPKRSGGAEC